MTTANAAPTTLARPQREARAWAIVAGAGVASWLAWRSLLPLAAWPTYAVLGLAIAIGTGTGVGPGGPQAGMQRCRDLSFIPPRRGRNCRPSERRRP